ncbi:hypothetical protein [Paenibacillus sp. FSL R10-2734]|uniref:hypothetical protein n=1 Tax=Paenibacillus sp. FSL R10-2734 TaxID=2954691 RepID=UPI0030D78A9A
MKIARYIGFLCYNHFYLIYHFKKNDDTEQKMPYYLKRFLVKQFLNNYSTNLGLEGFSINAKRGGASNPVAKSGE